MEFLQRLGKSLMLPVACMPLCGLLMGIGYLLCPASMQGGAVTGTLPVAGQFLVRAGSVVIDQIPVLFAVGVGVGMCRDGDGTAALAALISWFMIGGLLHPDFVSLLIGSLKNRPETLLAFQKVSNPFIGIIAGLIAAFCYDRFRNARMPRWLSFFSGKRCVAIVSGMVSILVSALLILVWPLLFG
ncbi:MAG: PTS transporter subunit EIIC, partial [Lachnospiraceae bacterium]|nr:PTS transporter subunit EIIC [Lachnospiraceae bacterium]